MPSRDEVAGDANVPSSEIYRTACLLVERHGPDAAVLAVRRIYELADRGDEDGLRDWVRILKALEGGQNSSRPGRPTLH